MITVISFIIVLGILVFFHELGHYWVARRNGIVVEEFGMGYPPRMIKLFRYDGTDFTINWIPFGGFARMKGEDAGDASSGSLNSASIGARAATMAAGPAMNFMLAVLLFAASFMAGFPAVVGYPQLTAIPANSQAANLGLQTNDILVSLNGRPVQVSAVPDFSFNVMADRESGAPTGELQISRDGQVVTLPAPTSATVDQIISGASIAPVLTTQISMVMEGTPADTAGMMAGDIVYAVDDEVISFANPLNEVVQRKLGQDVSITLLRNSTSGGEWVTLRATPRAEPPPGQGEIGRAHV